MGRNLAASASLIVFIMLISGSVGFASAQPNEQPLPDRVAVIGPGKTQDNVAHLMQLLMHEGYPYDYLNVENILPDLHAYTLVILYQEGLDRLDSISPTANSTIANYQGSLMWIGPGIGLLGRNAAAAVFGVRPVAEDLAGNMGVAYATSGVTKTMIQNETVTRVALAGAIADGYFLSNSSNTMYPAETHLKRASGTFAYYFAYDVSDWWKADPNLPWSRPAFLVSAIQAALSYTPSVSLHPYPMNLDALFIERIEDVDALHNAPEWVNRAQEFRQAFTANQVPLTVALIPVYVDPGEDLTIPMSADTAQPVRQWLVGVIESGGTIVQHGYTHQWGPFNSGAGTEFLLNGTWMSYGGQLTRIEQGKELLQSLFPGKITAFEAPHYKANNDTINALFQLGYEYYFDDPNSPFFSFRYDNNSGSTLVVFPETLSYVPLNATPDFETWTKASVDELYSFNGILLQYDHLYDDSEYKVGVDTMSYILQKGHVWTPTIEGAGQFELDRAKAYAGFSVAVGSDAIVNLGEMAESGLTLTLSNAQRILWVQVNGKPWALFGANYIILPALPDASNAIRIGFDATGNTQPSPPILGIIVAAIATTVTLLLTKKFLGEV